MTTFDFTAPQRELILRRMRLLRDEIILSLMMCHNLSWHDAMRLEWQMRQEVDDDEQEFIA